MTQRMHLFYNITMQIEFLGATGTVTGSRFLLRVHSKNYLVDCGLFQGLKVIRSRNWKEMPVHPRDISAVFLTHAHIDHSGYLPLLVKKGFKGPIYCSTPTEALCKVLLPDSGHLQEEDADLANREGFSKHEKALPLYTAQDAVNSLQYIRPIEWRKTVTIDEDFKVTFLPSGHILGASMVQVHYGNRTITFTGDLGRMTSGIMDPPGTVTDTDYLVIESTYGNRKHPEEHPREQLKEIINNTIKEGGTVLIPSFAVGRAQSILHILYELKKKKEIPDIPVYLDSPMAVEATHLFCLYDDAQALEDEECQAMIRSTHLVTSVIDSQRLMTRKDPAVILSASGMATGGRVLHHISNLAGDPRNVILFGGYQAPGTRGQAMLAGAKEIKIHGKFVQIKAKVTAIEGLSAHADASETIEWLKKFHKPPRETFIVHGEPDSSEALRVKIKDELGWNVTVPDYLDSFEI